MSDNETYYDEVVAPALLDIAKRLHDRGMSMVATVEYAPGKCGSTYEIHVDACLDVRMLQIMSHAGCNVDSFMIGLIRYCKREGINTDASAFMRIAAP